MRSPRRCAPRDDSGGFWLAATYAVAEVVVTLWEGRAPPLQGAQEMLGDCHVAALWAAPRNDSLLF